MPNTIRNLKKRIALIEMGKDGSFTIFTPDIKSTLLGEGCSVAEAKTDFENSVKEIISTFEESGLKDPDDLKNITFVYKYDMPSFLNYYDYYRERNLLQHLSPSWNRREINITNIMKTVEVIVEYAGKNLSAYIEGAPIITVGNNLSEVENNMREAIELYLEDNPSPVICSPENMN